MRYLGELSFKSKENTRVLVLAISTYNRINYLRKLLESFNRTRNTSLNWNLIIADDGSTDGTIEFLEQLNMDDCEINLIKNNRNGIHHQFNTIVKELENIHFEFCFKCDDDIEFIQSGWDNLYIEAIQNTGYDHLCHFDPSWRPEKTHKSPVVKGGLIGYCKYEDVQGAFFTLTPRVVRDIGYMDTSNFGFRGVGHIDYTMRAARLGYNHLVHPFDVRESNKYIKHQDRSAAYFSAMNPHLVNALENDEESKRKYALIQDTSRRYIDYYENAPSLSKEMERVLLIDRIEALESEKKWYQEQYDHQPTWYVRLGKVLFNINKVINR